MLEHGFEKELALEHQVETSHEINRWCIENVREIEIQHESKRFRLS